MLIFIKQNGEIYSALFLWRKNNEIPHKTPKIIPDIINAVLRAYISETRPISGATTANIILITKDLIESTVALIFDGIILFT